MDAVDEVVLTAAAAVAPGARSVLTLNDATGELTAAYAGARAYADSLVVERRLAESPLRVEPAGSLDMLLCGADLVLLRLPKSLAALDEYAGLVARHAAPGVALLAGGRVKHMTRGMNEVLARHFDDVRASLGVRKARGLLASGPRPGPNGWPAQERHDDLGLTLCAHGACFGGTKVDRGTRLLLGALADSRADSGQAIDLGSGNGTIAAWLALRGIRVTAIDESRAACASTVATTRANGVADLVDVCRADGLEGIAPSSQRLIVCNPPFHVGTAKDTATALGMIGAAGRALASGGTLWLVWNAHLPYLPALRRLVGTSEIMARDPKFIVTRSVRG